MQRLTDQLKDLIIQAGHQIEDDQGQDVPIFCYSSEDHGYRCNCAAGIALLNEFKLILDDHQSECIFKQPYSVSRYQ